MKKWVCILPLFLILACNGMEVSDAAPSSVGFYNYAPLAQKILDTRKEEGVEAPALTQDEVLSLITNVKNGLEDRGMTVIGIEAEKARIWFSKPIE